LGEVISSDIIFLLAIFAYTTIFSYFIVAKGTDSRIVRNNLQLNTKLAMNCISLIVQLELQKCPLPEQCVI